MIMGGRVNHSLRKYFTDREMCLDPFGTIVEEQLRGPCIGRLQRLTKPPNLTPELCNFSSLQVYDIFQQIFQVLGNGGR